MRTCTNNLIGRSLANVCSHINLRIFHFESRRLNTLKILFRAFNYKYIPTSSFHSLDVDIPGVDFPGVGGIAEEDVDCPLPVRGEQLLGLLLHLVTASRPDLGSRAAVATRAVQPTNLRKWVKSLLREMT